MLANICEKHKILEKCWLRTMYEKQQFWIPCYLNDVFFVGMTRVVEVRA